MTGEAFGDAAGLQILEAAQVKGCCVFVSVRYNIGVFSLDATLKP